MIDEHMFYMCALVTDSNVTKLAGSRSLEPILLGSLLPGLNFGKFMHMLVLFGCFKILAISTIYIVVFSLDLFLS